MHALVGESWIICQAQKWGGEKCEEVGQAGREGGLFFIERNLDAV